MKKRILAILMTLCIVVGLLPTAAWAEGVTDCSGSSGSSPCDHAAAVTVNGTTTHYNDVQEAIKAAAPAGTVEILNDVTVETWTMFAEDMSHSGGNLIKLNIDGLTINGNGHTLTINNIVSAGNGDYLFYDAAKLNINNLTIKYGDSVSKGGIGLQSGVLNNITIEGGVYGVFPGTGNVSITNSTFKTKGTAIYYESGRNLTVTGNTFDFPADKYAIILRGNETFSNNNVNGRVNIASGSPTVSGNTFADGARLKVYNAATATITNNKITVLAFENDSTVNSTFCGNTLSDAARAELDKVVVAKVGDTEYAALSAAITAATDGGTVTLLNDVTLTVPENEKTGAVDINKDVTIDLNGKTITGQNTRVFHVKSGTLNLTGEGTVTTVAATSNPIGVSSSVIRVGNDTTTATTTAELIVDKNVTIEAPATYGVSVFGSGTTETATVYGKIHSTATTDASYNGCAISTLGTDINTPATVNIMEGAVLTAANTNAVYAPSGTLNISGGTITGTTGVYFKSTNMTISGGTITGNGEKKDYEYYGDGGISTGDALTIDSCNYPGGINTISVTGGTFISKNAAAVGSYNSKGGALLTGFITGGTFSTNPSDYVAKDYIVRKDSDTSYTVVAKENLTSGVYMSDPSGSVASGYVVSGSGPYTVSVYIPTTTTTTTTNDDGSKTTTTTDKSTGATTETTTSQPVTDEAGNTTQTTTETVTQKDGSTTETVTETVKAADGSTATKVIETDAAGETSTTVEATVSTQAVTQAAETDTAVTIPVAVTAVKAEDSESAAVVTVNVPSAVTEDNTVQVEIPVENLTTGTVAIVVNADGTEEIVKTSTLGEEGVVLTLEGDATVKIVDNSKIFEDVHPVDHWAEDAVTYVAAREMFEGTGNNNFSPDEDLNRAMLMTVLARYDGQDTTGGETWYEQGMNWAVQNGVSDGTNPEVSISREQMVTMIWRYAGKPESSHALAFSDAHDINDWAEEAMRWAVSTGIINGVGNNALDPQGPATRAQVATVMMRFCEKINK